MLLFKIITVTALVVELILTFLIKFNVKGMQDNLYNKVKDKSIEHYIREDYPNRSIVSNIILLILIILAIC